MAEAIKVLGQLVPAAATLEDLYEAPADGHAVVSTLMVCEQGGAAAVYRIAVAVAGAADDPKQYLVFDAALAAGESKAFTIGITLGEGDVVRVRSDTGDVSFNLFGAETTP